MNKRRVIAISLGKNEKGQDILEIRDDVHSHRELLEKVAEKRNAKNMSQVFRTLLDEEAERLGIAND